MTVLSKSHQGKKQGEERGGGDVGKGGRDFFKECKVEKIYEKERTRI